MDTVSYDYDSTWGDLLVSYDGVNITSDPIGNVLDDGTWDYTWEHGRQLASMTGNGTTWSYSYDAEGMRYKRTNGSTTYTYYYNGSLLRYLDINGAKLYFVLDANGQPIEVSYKPANSTTTSFYFYVHNLQGDVIAIVDTNGSTVVQYTYDAWGKLLSTTGSMASTLGQQNPFRYRSYVYDQETGLYYLQSRYYNPAIGRFINADALVSTGQGILGNNMFAYCLNNPIRYYDKDGRHADTYAGWIGEELGEFFYELITGEEHPSDNQEEVERRIIQKRNDMFANSVQKLWNAWVHSNELQAELQYQQSVVVRDFVEDRFSTLEKSANTLSTIGFALDAGAAYCGGIAAGLSIPTLGISTTTAGSAAAALALASLPFHGVALVLNILDEEG